MAKPATKYLKFKGKGAWFKLFEPDDYKGEKKWKFNLYPSDATLAEMKAAGLQNKVKEDDGEKSGVTGKFVGLKRETEKKFNGVINRFEPPIVYDMKGDEITDPIIIGNGSEVEVLLEVYHTDRFGAGSRIQEVKIIDLIEYVAPEEVTENEVDEAAEAEEEVPEEKPAKPARKRGKVAW